MTEVFRHSLQQAAKSGENLADQWTALQQLWPAADASVLSATWQADLIANDGEECIYLLVYCRARSLRSHCVLVVMRPSLEVYEFLDTGIGYGLYSYETAEALIAAVHDYAALQRGASWRVNRYALSSQAESSDEDRLLPRDATTGE